MSRKLKIEIVRRGLTQRSVAREAGIAPGDLSRIACGRMLPTAEQADRIARVLGVERSKLFPRTWGEQ